MKQKGVWMIEIKEIINTHLVEAWNCFIFFASKTISCSEWKRAPDKRDLIAYKQSMSVRHQFYYGQ